MIVLLSIDSNSVASGTTVGSGLLCHGRYAVGISECRVRPECTQVETRITSSAIAGHKQHGESLNRSHLHLNVQRRSLGPRPSWRTRDSITKTSQRAGGYCSANICTTASSISLQEPLGVVIGLHAF